ncbi:MAG TPA: MFS transporter [Noviherbaspirillum sp.]|uniref:MFS transporter n=1 Tax=Noviherbaspirillum sp. TaxID=1926288 RepID=UPI002D5345C6|nr:MFS transporter [Noviherbaspirillum sp.]HYD94149.1 MFS transporter [Noviherbaspirillum sp.]
MHKQQTDNRALRGDRNFLWLAAGALVSMVGDQFTLIALPWLVLKMTGDPLVLGTVLAVTSIPRALFILVGGALVDRHSPKRVLMLTKYLNTLLLGALAALVFTGHASLPLVYALAFAIGLSTAFSIPAGSSIMPHVVRPEHLQQANGAMMGIRQLSFFIGPLLAGGLIAVSGSASGGMQDAQGLALAFLFDAISYAASAWTLARVTLRAHPAPAQADAGSVWKSVAEGLRYCWNERSLRVCFAYWAAIALFISGPVHVAVPVLAERIGDSAAALGVLVGAHGAGTLLGMMLSGIRPGLRLRSFGATLLLLDGVIGLLFMPLGLIDATWQGGLLLLAIGMLGGVVQVKVYTWLQRAAPPALLGRTMALFMFIFLGIAPMSSALTGLLMRSIALPQLFAGAGLLLVAIVGITYAGSGMRSIQESPAPGAVPGTGS